MLQSRTFAGIVSLLFIVNLLIMNDIVAYWSPIELGLLTGESETSNLLAAITKWSEGNEFSVRLCSSFFIITGLACLFYFGKRLFGIQDMTVASLFVMSSLLLVQLGKTLSGDALLFLFQALIFLSNIMYIKQAKKAWLLTYNFSFFAALLLNFVPSLVFAALLWSILYIKHPQGKRSTALAPWGSIILASIIYYFRAYSFFPEGFWLDYNTLSLGKYLLIIFLGIVPFLPFAFAGLKHNILKFQKKEELSIILIALLAASLSSYSLMFQFALALMAAKQIKDYEKPYYNHEQTVKTTSVLLLLASFFALAAMMIYSFEYLREPGFRAAILIAGVFWVFNFISVVGVYAKKSAYAYGGMVLSGLLFSFFIWTQLVPLYESKAAVAKQLIYKIEKEKPSLIVYDSSLEGKAMTYYAKQHNLKAIPAPGPDSINSNMLFIGLNKDKNIITKLNAWHSSGVDTTYYISRIDSISK